MKTYIIIFLSFFALSSCTEEDVSNNFFIVPEGEGELISENSNVAITDVNSNFTGYRHASTKNFFHFKEEKAVLVIDINDDEVKLVISSRINLFPDTETDESISQWINNQHNDVIYSSAAEPFSILEIDPETIHIVSKVFQAHIVGYSGDEYNEYTYQYYFDNTIVDNTFSISSFVYQTSVFARTKDITYRLIAPVNRSD